MRPEEVHALAVAAGLDHERAVIATAIAWGESSLRPDAVGDEGLQDATWGPSCGLWQVRSLKAQYGTGKDRDAQRLFDPEFNARSMVSISSRGTNWQPWTIYRNGAYRKHLDAVRRAVDHRQEAPLMQEWMPGAIRTPPRNRSGLAWIGGTNWKLVLHTTESNYRRSGGGRDNYHGHQNYPHFEVSEAAIEQYLPITRGAYALSGGTDQYGQGNAAHAVQIEIVWNASNIANLNDRVLRNVAAVLTYLRRATGMRPNLPPQGFPRSPSQPNEAKWFSKAAWYAFEGLCGHGNVPGNFSRWDPGPIDAGRIVALSNADLGGTAPKPEEESELFKPTTVPTFHVAAAHSRLLWDLPGLGKPGDPIETYASDGGPDQRWEVYRHEDGAVTFLTSTKDGTRVALDIPDFKAEVGVGLQVVPVNWSPAQRFRFEDAVGGVRIRHESGLVVDVRHAGGKASPLQLWTPRADLAEELPHRLFLLVPTV